MQIVNACGCYSYENLLLFCERKGVAKPSTIYEIMNISFDTMWVRSIVRCDASKAITIFLYFFSLHNIYTSLHDKRVALAVWVWVCVFMLPHSNCVRCHCICASWQSFTSYQTDEFVKEKLRSRLSHPNSALLVSVRSTPTTLTDASISTKTRLPQKLVVKMTKCTEYRNIK